MLVDVALDWGAGKREVGIDHEGNIEAIWRNWKFDKVGLCQHKGPFLSTPGTWLMHGLILAESAAGSD